jgi:hypothetical protein
MMTFYFLVLSGQGGLDLVNKIFRHEKSKIFVETAFFDERTWICGYQLYVASRPHPPCHNIPHFRHSHCP